MMIRPCVVADAEALTDLHLDVWGRLLRDGTSKLEDVGRERRMVRPVT